eukprot:5142095-Pleurochrysis_carterae.AAC.1
MAVSQSRVGEPPVRALSLSLSSRLIGAARAGERVFFGVPICGLAAESGLAGAGRFGIGWGPRRAAFA